MAAEIEFDAYLRSLSTHYDKWWQLYTLTDAQTKTQQEPSPFDFGLMVQTVKKERSSNPDNPEGQDKEKSERFPVLEGIRKYVAEHRQVLLVGRPGSGKSTTLARLLLEEARGALGTGDRDGQYLRLYVASGDPPNPLKKGELEVDVFLGEFSNSFKKKEAEVDVPLFKGDLGGSRGLRDTTKIPVLVELRFWSGSLIDRIQAFFQRHDLLLDRTQIEDLLFHRRLLLLMDGLNELPSEAARLDVAKFRQDYPKVSMIFTTRDLSLGGDFGLEKKLEMQPLTEAQMQAFVRSYVPEQSEAMLRQLKDRLREFGQTPLLLWMLCGLFRQTGQIPANLGEVFRAFTQGYGKNLKADVPVESDRRWWPELLQELAFWMMRGVPFGEIAPTVDVEFRAAISKVEARQIFTAFLQNKEAQSEGVAQKYLDDLLRHHLIQMNGKQVEFRHQLLQEYYAAEYLLEYWEQLSELEFKRDYLNYLKWTESIAMMVGLTNNPILALQVVEAAIKLDWMLGARLAGEVTPDLQLTTVAQVNELEIPIWLKIRLLENTRSLVAIPNLIKVLEEDPSYEGWRAAEALGRLGYEQAVPALFKAAFKPPQDLEHYGDYDTHIFAGFALRRIGSKQVVPDLIQALEDKDVYRRSRALDILGGLDSEYPGSEQAIPVLIKTAFEDESSFYHLEAASALGQLGSEQAVPALIKVLENDEDEAYLTSGNAASALGQLGSEQAVPALIKVLENNEDENLYKRRHTASALGQLGSEEAIPVLIKALEDEDPDVRRAAAVALGQLGSEQAVPALIQALENESSFVREEVAEALVQLGSEQTVTALIQALENESAAVRKSAAVILHVLGSEKAIPALVKTILEDEDPEVRSNSASTLGQLGSKQAVPALIKALEDEDVYVRVNTAFALWKLGSEQGVSILIKALEDEDVYVRRGAARFSGFLVPEQAFPALIKALEDEDPDVRSNSASALGQLGSEQAISALIQVLEDENSFIYWTAAKALEEIKNLAVCRILPQLVALIPTRSGKAAFERISAIQSNCKFYNYSITQTTQSMKLFFSYAHKDEPLRDQLATHLSLLKRQNIITDWHDRNITAGTDWAQAIDDNLNTASIILLLISADFLASDYCYDKEMTRALERHAQGTARVIPIILRPCDWHSAPFGKLQALPKDAKPITRWSNPDEAFTHIAQGIRKAVAELQQRKSSPPAAPPNASSPPPGNVTMNFYGTVHGAAGTVHGDQNIQP